MKTRILTLTFLLGYLALMPFAQADELADVKAALIKKLPHAGNVNVTRSPIPGLYQVMAGTQVLYVNKDASYALQGDIYDLASHKNLTEKFRDKIRKQEISDLGEKNMVVYTPKGKVKHTITVVTDIFCPYCRKLHSEMPKYMADGIKVRYVFAPFKGQKSVDASISVLCSKDRTKAMDMAKAGEPIEKKTCDSPIKEHQKLVEELGVRGTPAIILANGYMNPGYVPEESLKKQLVSMGL